MIMNKGKIIGSILGIILFVLLVAGATYAYITWTSEPIKNVVNSKCFDIYYTKGTDITGSIMPSNDYTNGLSTSIKFNINSSCDIDATGKLYLTTLDTTSSNLYREGLLNYQLLIGNTVTDVKGSITSSGEIVLDLGELTKATSASTSYTLYVWVDNNLVVNSDVNSVYYGNIRAETIQHE